MIELHTLGVLDLRGPAQPALSAVLRQPKRLALLAYLAVSSPRRFHRRDSLLALFWPDLDTEHARAALRRALYFLRARLGAETINGRGEEEVGVSDDVLWCDARAVEASLAAGDLESALALYRGPLLDGLYVAGAAPEFEEWLARERAHLRDRATRAARTLAEREHTGGRLQAAGAWARRALELAPDDEASLRRLMAILEASGERSAALRAYDEFARGLEREYQLAPSAESRQLAAALRTRVEALPEAVPAAAPSEDTIAVLPFEVRGDPRVAYLGEGLVDLLATKLDGAGELRTVDPRALLHHVSARPAPADPVAGHAVATHFGAGRFLLGSIVEAGGRLQLAATLYSGAGVVLAAAHATGDESGLFGLVDDFARQLLASPGVGRGTRLSRLAARTTDSLDALKAHLSGERELRSGRYFDAMEHFQEATETDPTFALAHYRLAAAAAGCAMPELAREAADRAHEHRDRLAPHDRLVLAAQRAWLDGRVGEAESLYTTITGIYPDDVEAWFHLGDLLFHANPLRGRSSAESRVPFDRVLALRPDHVAAMVHLARLAALERRLDDMESLVGRLLQASPDGDQALPMRALRAFARDDRAEMARLTAELQGARPLTVGVAFADAALYARNLEGAEALGRSFLAVARAPELRALCHIMLAHLALAMGRAEQAGAEVRHAEELDRAWGLETRALLALLPWAPVSDAELMELRESLERWDPSAVEPSGFILFAMHDDLHPALRLFLLGAIEVRLGLLEPARVRAQSLAALRVETGGALVENLARGLDARVLAREGRRDEAIRALESTRPELWFQLTVASPFFSLASERYLRAELLRDAGRTDEATGWYASIAERSPFELVYREPAEQAIRRIQQASAFASRQGDNTC